MFVGRSAEVKRLEQGLAYVPLALIYGVAGVGKSALAYTYAARYDGEVIYGRATDGESIAALVDTTRRQLAGGPVEEAATDDDRLESLALALDARGALWVVDDLDRLAPETRAYLIAEIATLLSRGRMIATSREIVPLPEGEPERVEIRLTGLEQPAAASLWSLLDELYGPSAGFESAYDRLGGNPLLLRRAHAGGLEHDDPIADAVRGLGADERLVASALALAVPHLRSSWLDGLFPDHEGRGRQALRSLVVRMLVEVNGLGTCVLHDLYRRAIAAQLSAAETARMHRLLATLLETTDLEPVERAREVARHLLELGSYDEAGSYLVERAQDFTRHGAARELFEILDRIPPQARSVAVRLTFARTLVRLVEVHRAFEELALLAKVAPTPDVKLSFARVAMLVGELDVAEVLLRELLADDGLSGHMRTSAVINLGVALTARGKGEEARALLGETAQGADQHERGLLTFARAYSLWLEERDAEIEEPMRLAEGLMRAELGSLRSRFLAPTFLMGVLARAGRFDESEEAGRRAAARMHDTQDPRMRVYYSAMHACLEYERGRYVAAATEYETAARAFERGGERVSGLWTRCWLARALARAGRVREAILEFDRVEVDIRALGVVVLEPALARGRAFLPKKSPSAPPDDAEDDRATGDPRLDERTHEIRFGDTTVSLKTRPAVRALLYALARAAGTTLSKEVLARAVWPSYSPSVHDNALYVNIRRLRAALQDTPLRVEREETGYRLVAPPGFIFLRSRS